MKAKEAAQSAASVSALRGNPPAAKGNEHVLPSYWLEQILWNGRCKYVYFFEMPCGRLALRGSGNEDTFVIPFIRL